MPNATTTSKPAASSPSAAAPSASPAAGSNDALPRAAQEATRGAFVDHDDIMAALLAEDSAQPNDERTAPAATAETDDEPDSRPAADDATEPAAEAPAAEADAPEPEPAAAEATAEADDPAAEPSDDEAPATTEEPTDPKRDGRNDRIDELTAKRHELEAQLAKAQERLASFEARDAGRLEPDVLEHVDSLASLSDAQKKFSALHVWALRHPEGGTLGQQEYDAEGVRELLAQTFELVNSAIPRRRDYLAQRESVEREAVTHYPWLKEQGRGHGARVQQLITTTPQLRAVPNHRLILADAVVGEALRQAGVRVDESLIAQLAKGAKAKGNAAPAVRPAAKAPAMPAKAGVLPPRQTPRAAQSRAALQRVQADHGSEASLVDLIAANLS